MTRMPRIAFDATLLLERLLQGIEVILTRAMRSVGMGGMIVPGVSGVVMPGVTMRGVLLRADRLTRGHGNGEQDNDNGGDQFHFLVG